MARTPSESIASRSSAASAGLRIFGNKPFMRFARKFRASDQDLWDAAQGEPDADLGGGVFKLRIAREGEGLRGGARAIIAMKKRQRIVMMFGFEKKDLSNIDAKELKGFRKLAKVYLQASEQQMESLVKRGELAEIKARPAKQPSQTK